MSKEELQVNFRMPMTLKRTLEREAKSNGRSLTAEVVARLENTVSLDSELGERTDGDLDHSSIMSWVSYVEGLNVEQREELAELRKNPIVLDGAELAEQVGAAVVSPNIKALVSFLVLQAAYPNLVSDAHRERIAIFAARIADVSGTNPQEILEALTQRMVGEALALDLGL